MSEQFKMLSIISSSFRVANHAMSRRPIQSTILSAVPTTTTTLLSRSLDLSLPSLFHTSLVLDRARQVTRARKRKIVLANIKKKAERLRKNPKPMAKKVELMLKSKGLWGPPKPIRYAGLHNLVKLSLRIV